MAQSPDPAGAHLVTDKNLGPALILLRELRGLSGTELARLSGIRGSAISQWENRRKEPTRASLGKLLAALRYPPAALDRVLELLRALKTEYGATLDDAPYPTGTVPSSEVAEPGFPPGPSLSSLRSEAERVAVEVGKAAQHLAFFSLWLDILKTAEPGAGEAHAGPPPRGSSTS